MCKIKHFSSLNHNISSWNHNGPYDELQQLGKPSMEKSRWLNNWNFNFKAADLSIGLCNCISVHNIFQTDFTAMID